VAEGVELKKEGKEGRVNVGWGPPEKSVYIKRGGQSWRGKGSYRQQNFAAPQTDDKFESPTRAQKKIRPEGNVELGRSEVSLGKGGKDLIAGLLEMHSTTGATRIFCQKSRLVIRKSRGEKGGDILSSFGEGEKR